MESSYCFTIVGRTRAFSLMSLRSSVPSSRPWCWFQRLECNPVVVHLRGLLQSNDDRQAYASLVHQLGVGGTQVLNATIPRLFEISAKAISEGAKNSQTYVVILEDFEIFALRPKQAFLYSLFNLAQGSDVGIVLIGTSIRIDAADLLEKRVRSRFSERVLVVPRPADVDEVRFPEFHTVT